METGRYEAQVKIPVSVVYTKRDDGSVSIHAVSVPDEEKIYKIVYSNSEGIKEEIKKEIAEGDKIFSGEYSEDFWNMINEVQDEEVHEALYLIGCRLQEFEAKMDDRLQEDKANESKTNKP